MLWWYAVEEYSTMGAKSHIQYAIDHVTSLAHENLFLTEKQQY